MNTCAQTAAEVRAALKVKFPGVKFSVRSKTYSGGASIDVEWTDGPKADRVKAVTDSMQGADFDGMQDLKTYRSNGSGADFIFQRRNTSPEWKAKIAAQVSEYLAVDLDKIPHHYGETLVQRASCEYEGAMIDPDRLFYALKIEPWLWKEIETLRAHQPLPA